MEQGHLREGDGSSCGSSRKSRDRPALGQDVRATHEDRGDDEALYAIRTCALFNFYNAGSATGVPESVRGGHRQRGARWLRADIATY